MQQSCPALQKPCLQRSRAAPERVRVVGQPRKLRGRRGPRRRPRRRPAPARAPGEPRPRRRPRARGRPATQRGTLARPLGGRGRPCWNSWDQRCPPPARPTTAKWSCHRPGPAKHGSLRASCGPQSLGRSAAGVQQRSSAHCWTTAARHRHRIRPEVRGCLVAPGGCHANRWLTSMALVLWCLGSRSPRAAAAVSWGTLLGLAR